MDQDITPLHLQEGGFVTLSDGRHVWSTGVIEYPDGYTDTSRPGIAGVIPPADGSHGTSLDPFGRSIKIVSVPRNFTSQGPKQEAGPSGRSENPETNGEFRLENQTATTTKRAPLNLDPYTGYYRAFVKFMDGKKVSEAELRQHLEKFGPLGPYLTPSSGTTKNHTTFAEFKTLQGFKAAEAAGRHPLGDVEIWIQERDDRELLRNKRTRPGAGNGPPMPPPPVRGFADRGGKATSPGLRPSQLPPINTFPRILNNPHAASTFSPSRIGTPGAPSLAVARYEADSGPSFPGGCGFPRRDRANSIRNDNRTEARRPSITATTYERRTSLFEDLGHRRGVSHPRPD
ncbi:hypothetical protein E6O75_ATG04299 [Venturia nashicola]|uniref:Uncharacterized protein n=1 Tax=Venturia nashicola TaxID=86259 RepID=A0A4Z1PR28_9PEZI|nr:hypothetical protein E6O75_ATG04299 [Venturia nashicola]